MCLWGRCSSVGSWPWGGTFHLSGHREAATEQESFSNKRWAASWHFGVISRLNNLPMSCWNAKKTSYRTTNVSYLFPFGASQQKQNSIIRTYVEFLKASNSSVISGCEVKAYCPLPFMKMGFECSPPVFNSVAQFFPCLPFLIVFKRCISPHNLKDSELVYDSFSLLCHFLWFVFPFNL